MKMLLTFLIFFPVACQGQTALSHGKDFVTAFPENVAYYYPTDPVNALKITAFKNGTTVTIFINQSLVSNTTLQSGQIKVFHFPKSMEQYKFSPSLLSVRVTSNFKIGVILVSQRGGSVQSNVIQPVKNLGTLYSIPVLNYTDMVASLNPSDKLTANIPRYNSFRLMMINAWNVVNNISVLYFDGSYNFSLRPYELVQYLVQNLEVTISSSFNLAVMLTHPCVQLTPCGCNMLLSQVLPQTLWGDSFVVPSLENVNSTWLNMFDSSSQMELQNLPMKSEFVNTTTLTSLRILSPGFVIDLIPESMFAACYLVQLSTSLGRVFVVSETAYTSDLFIDDVLLSSTDWKPIAGSSYSSLSLLLSGTHIIWHSSSVIAVYMFDFMDHGVAYGSVAMVLNQQPDVDGCGADAAKYLNSTDPMTWPESYQYCLNTSYDMITPDSTKAQMELAGFLQTVGSSEQVWIGLRRSLLTLQWYWQSDNQTNENVTYTHWAAGHPLEAWKGLCTVMSQDANLDFSWKSVSCCSKMKTFCYRSGTYFSDVTFQTPSNAGDVVYPKVSCLIPQLCLLNGLNNLQIT